MHFSTLQAYKLLQLNPKVMSLTNQHFVLTSFLEKVLLYVAVC